MGSQADGMFGVGPGGSGRQMTMGRNDAVRARVRVMMADGDGLRHDDAVASAVISLMLESMGAEPPTFPGPARELAALRASEVLDRIGLLSAVVDAAEGYKRAERRGKGRKKAQKRLFEAVAAWRDVVPGHA